MIYHKTVLQIIGLYGLNWVGTLLQKALHLPLSGSIIGLLLLFLLLYFKLLPEALLETGAKALLKVLPFLFLPSVLGIMQEGTFFREKGLLFITLVIISTFLTMGTTAWVTERVSHSTKRREKGENI